MKSPSKGRPEARAPKGASPKPARAAAGPKSPHKSLSCKAVTARHFRVWEDLQSGMGVSAVAKKNHLTRQSVWNIKCAFRRGGSEALVCTVTGGRRPCLSASDAHRFREALCKPAKDGLPSVWTVPQATKLARRVLGKEPSRITVRKTLHRDDVALLGDRVAPWLDGRGWSSAMRRWVRSGYRAALRASHREGMVLLAVWTDSLAMPVGKGGKASPHFRLSAAGGREPVRSALVRGRASRRAVEGFLRAVAKAVGRPARFVLDEEAFFSKGAAEAFSRRTGLSVDVVSPLRPGRR